MDGDNEVEEVPADPTDGAETAPTFTPDWKRVTRRSMDSLLAEAGVVELHPFQRELRMAAAEALHADVLLEAPTGAGKTIAFLLVAFDDMDARDAPVGPPAVLVITPTRELAQQTDRVFIPFARGVNRRVALLQGGVPYDPQLRNMSRGADVAVGTPGRLLDLLQHGQLTLDGVVTVVIDEADRLADMGFLDDVGQILDAVPTSARTVLVSATLSGPVGQLVDRLRPGAISVRTEGDADRAPEGLGLGTVDNPHRRVTMIRERLRADVGALLDASGRSLVFVRTRHSADRWAGWIVEDGRQALALHGGVTTAGRRQAIGDFRSGAVSILVATDLASRGLDMAGVELVLHLERSDDERDYVHRSGRTGRAGAPGVVVNMVRKEQRRPLLAMEQRLGVTAVDGQRDDVLRMLDDLAPWRSRSLLRWPPPLGRTTSMP